MKSVLFLLFVLLPHVQADPAGQQAKLDELSRDLGDQSFEIREAASKKLKKLVTGDIKKDLALQHLKVLWRNSENPEIRTRLFTLGRELYLPTKGSMFGFRFMADTYLTIDGQRTVCLNVNEVINPSPALTGGMQAKDLIYGVNNVVLGSGRSLEDLVALFRRLSPEETHDLRIRRDGKDITLKIRPGEQPLLPEDHAHFKKAFQNWLLAKNDAPEDENE